MATIQGMSGLDVRVMTTELAAHLPLWFGKIYQYDNKTLGIRLNGEDKAKYSFLIESGRRAHFTESLPPAPGNPSGYSMLLRKYLSGGKVLQVRQYGFQRIFEFTIGKKDTSYHLIIELFDEGNVILCEENYTIIKPLWHHRFKNREVVPNVRYIFPGDERHSLEYNDVEQLLTGSKRDLVRTLAVGLMLGGVYAEEVCRMAGCDKTMPAAQANAQAIYNAYKELLSRAESNPDPVITKDGCWPVPIGEAAAATHYQSFYEALDAYYPKTRSEVREEKPKLTREEVIHLRQEAALVNFEREIERLGIIVESIYAHYPLVEEVIRTLDEASKTRSWQEIEAILTQSDNPEAKAVVAIHPADAAVDLDLEESRAKIYIHEGIEANIGRYYEQIKKFKKKRQGVIAILEKPIKYKEKVKKEFLTLKPRWYHRFRWCYTSDGILVIGGRDAGQNEELVKRYMEGGDRFVHTDIHGASVVIVKGETANWDEVAIFAASYSNAWKTGQFSADVYMVRPDQVSKTPESGEYVARGAFIIRGERTYFHNVPLGIAIGIQFEPAIAVIGGPKLCVAPRAKAWVLIKPGEFEPNDAAKKVLRLLRQMLADEDARALKSVLNTESVAAFVPPGGSDIVDSYEG